MIIVSQVLSETVTLTRQNWRLALFAFAMWSIPQIIVDLTLDEHTAMQFSGLWTLVMLWVQIVITHHLLSICDGFEVIHGQRKFYPRIFWQSLLSGIALIICLLLFIIPGILLAARWSISAVLILARDIGAVDGLNESWEMTSGHTLKITAIYLILSIPLGIGLLFAMHDSWTAYSISSLLVSATQVLWWHAAVAVFLRLRSSAT